MAVIKKISFLGENTNLLQMVKQNSVSAVNENQNKAATPQQEPVKPVPVQQEDVFVSAQKEVQKPKSKFNSFVEKYSGIAALVIAVVGLPVVYVKARKSGANISNELKDIKKVLSELSKNAVKTEAKTSKSNSLIMTLLALGSGAGIAEYLKSNKDKHKTEGYTEEEIENAKNVASNILDEPKKALDAAKNVNGLAQEAKAVAYETRNIAYDYNDKINSANNKADEALRKATTSNNPLLAKYTENHHGLNLLKILDYDKKIDLSRSEDVYNSIENASLKRLTRSAADTLKDIKEYRNRYDTKLKDIWSLTAEFDPIKLGGLGTVPVELQDNFNKLGISMPTFIPMYLKKNEAEFRELGADNYQYKYKNKTFNLKKIAQTSTHVFRRGIPYQEELEYYLCDNFDTKENKQIVFIKNRNYFNGNIYDSTIGAEETEKFALFTKAVYKLAKVKVAEALGQDLTGVANMEINDEVAYNTLKAPVSMILNDWHAGSMAGLLRYRAPMEYNYKEINKDTYDALKNMPTLLIGHNLGCQGKSNDGEGSFDAKNQVAENIINTLYDGYAAGVVDHAHSGIILEKEPNNDDLCNTMLLKRQKDDKHFNHLFNGVALSDWFVPVSKNYAKEIIESPEKSGILYNLLQRRKNVGTISGTVNGLDKNKNDMYAVANNNRVQGLTFEVYNQDTPIENIMSFRKENKRRFFEKFIKPTCIDRSNDKVEIIGAEGYDFDLSEQEFVNAPLISFAHRLTSQKGLGLLKGAIFRLYDNWEKEFGDKPLPVFLVGGPPESSEEVQYLYDLKNPKYGENKERLKRVITLKGNMPNPAIMAASEFFCAPSTYEPCGLTQGECFAKGTPVIATDTGGFHDTIVDGKTGFLAEEINEESLYNKLVEALKMYYFSPQKYEKMVKNALEVDFSWLQPGKKGPIYEYTDKLGIKRKEPTDPYIFKDREN